MISKLYAAWLACVAIYRQPRAFDEVLTVGVDTIGIKRVAGTMTITMLGTVDKAMWESNLEVIPVANPVFGEMHGGFATAGRAIFVALKPKIDEAVATGLNIAIEGHSRGGSLADYLAAECALARIKVTVFMFEAAPIGKQQYVNWCGSQVKGSMITVGISTVNGPDPVPFSDDVLGYISTYEVTNLNQPPGGLDDLVPTNWHAGDVIYAGMLKNFPGLA